MQEAIREGFPPAVVEKLRAEGFTCVLWKFVSGDWKNPDAWMTKALADCRANPWSMVVLHDIPSGAMLHLDEFLKELEAEGNELQSLEMFSPSLEDVFIELTGRRLRD